MADTAVVDEPVTLFGLRGSTVEETVDSGRTWVAGGGRAAVVASPFAGLCLVSVALLDIPVLREAAGFSDPGSARDKLVVGALALSLIAAFGLAAVLDGGTLVWAGLAGVVPGSLGAFLAEVTGPMDPLWPVLTLIGWTLLALAVLCSPRLSRWDGLLLLVAMALVAVGDKLAHPLPALLGALLALAAALGLTQSALTRPA